MGKWRPQTLERLPFFSGSQGALSLGPFLPSLPETDALVLWVKISHPWRSVPCPGCLLSCLPPSLRLGGGTHGQCPLPREGVRHAPGTEGHCPQRCESESPQEVLPSGKLGVSSWPGGESYNGIQPCSADTPAFTGAMGTGWGQMALGAAQPQFCPLLWPLPATGLRQVSQHFWPQLVAW